jgi:hypothetical protein
VPRRSSVGWEEKEEHDEGAHARGSGRGWRAEEIEGGRGEARARESIGAADSKRFWLGKIGQRRLWDGQRWKIEDRIERLLDRFFFCYNSYNSIHGCI